MDDRYVEAQPLTDAEWGLLAIGAAFATVLGLVGLGYKIGRRRAR